MIPHVRSYVILSIGLAFAMTLTGKTSVPLEQRCLQAGRHYARLLHAQYSDALADARDLNQSLQAFVQEPTPTNLARSQRAWITNRDSYLPTEAARFYGGPIDDARGLEPLINGWPLDEFYIDYTEGAPQAGIISKTQTYPRITADLLQRLNERAGETAITCGFHAIEFLLWGQDMDPDGPGHRPVSDYTTAPHAERRGQYLKACGELLERHLTLLVDDWAPATPNNYRARFLADDSRRAVWYAVYGLRTFAGKELAGERLLVAWDTQAQEDEHSCFSDNTLNDLRADAKGLSIFLSGTYQRNHGQLITGPGLATVLRDIDPANTIALEHEIEAAQRAIELIPPPFDQAILSTSGPAGRDAIWRCVEHLETLATLLAPFEQALIKATASSQIP